MSSIITKRSNPFLIISGQITVSKKIEFEHTFRIGFSSLSRDCLSRNLSEDCDQEGMYYFFSLWSNNSALQHFLESPEFQLLNGAFHALGSVSQTINGNVLKSEPEIHISLS